MAVLDVPHFDLPFRLTAGGIKCVEQDSYEDISNCVECIVRVPVGFRNDAPDFGFPHLEFNNQPLGHEDIEEFIESQEPRAEILATEKPDFYDVLIDRISIEILEAEITP